MGSTDSQHDDVTAFDSLLSNHDQPGNPPPSILTWPDVVRATACGKGLLLVAKDDADHPVAISWDKLAGVRLDAEGIHFEDRVPHDPDTYAVAPADKPWNFKPGDYTLEQLVQACAWVNDVPEDELGKDDCKLPHHLPDGTLVPKGVQAAMQRLYQVKGIPDDDLNRVHSHLANHYEEFDQTPPAFRGDCADRIGVTDSQGRVLLRDEAALDLPGARFEDDGSLVVPTTYAAPMVQVYDIDGEKVRVLKHPAELRKAADYAEGRYVTDDHPPEGVVIAPDQIHGIARKIRYEDGIKGETVIRPGALLDKVKGGDKRGVSIGFRCTLDRTPGIWRGLDGADEPQEYDAVQRDILIDHNAVVKYGRCDLSKCGLGVDAAPVEVVADAGPASDGDKATEEQPAGDTMEEEPVESEPDATPEPGDDEPEEDSEGAEEGSQTVILRTLETTIHSIEEELVVIKDQLQELQDARKEELADRVLDRSDQFSREELLSKDAVELRKLADSLEEAREAPALYAGRRREKGIDAAYERVGVGG